MEERKCIYNDRCGGCQQGGRTYEETLKEKQEYVENLLNKYCKVNQIAGMYYPYNYRNKVHAVFGENRNGSIISGTYREGTHQVVNIDSCMIDDKKADEIILDIRKLAEAFKLKPYDEDRHTGILRHVLIRRGASTKQIMVVLVTPSEMFPSRRNFVNELLKIHPEINTVIQNVNPHDTSMVLGKYEKVLHGKGYIEDVLLGCTFRISSRSFYQINSKQTEVLYKTALNSLKLNKNDTVIDAYCGIGTISLAASKTAGNVIGVELNPDAVSDAEYNARANKISNVRFVCDDAGEFMVQLAEEGKRVDAVIMDPPRSGSTQVFIDALAKMAPEKVCYISCNPETLERDLNYFEKKGYKALEAWPVDMFGWTKHVETVCLLSKLH